MLNGPAYKRPLVTNIDAVRGVREGTLRELRKFVALHKHEPDARAQREIDAVEAHQDLNLLRHNITPIAHRRLLGEINRRFTPLLASIDSDAAKEGNGASTAAVSPGDASTSDDLIELRCRSPSADPSSEPNATMRRERASVLQQVSTLYRDAAAFAILVPEWRLCTAERARETGGGSAPSTVASPPPAPLRIADVPAERRGLAWRSLGGLSALREDRPASSWMGGTGLSLEECQAGCLADPTCRSIAHAPASGHCIPLSTPATAATPTKCIMCGCTCFNTHYLEPAASAAANAALPERREREVPPALLETLRKTSTEPPLLDVDTSIFDVISSTTEAALAKARLENMKLAIG